MTAFDLLPFVLLGALVGLDVVSFPQAMVSRPIVAATLGGLMAGAPLAGLVAGAVLELIALETLPVGASRYPEWGSASVVGGALYARYIDASAGALPLAVLGAVATAWAGGWTMYALRRLNGALARRRLAALDAGSPSAVTALQLTGMTADLARGALLTFVALAVLVPSTAWLGARWRVDAALSNAVTAGIGTAVAAAAAWTLTHAAPHSRWYFAGGLALGLGVLLWR